MEEVTGSSPVSSTKRNGGLRLIRRAAVPVFDGYLAGFLTTSLRHGARPRRLRRHSVPQRAASLP